MKTLSEALDALASRIPNGELLAATDPVAFIEALDHELVILGWIREWTKVFGVELCPSSHHTDTFGGGMSEAKRHVARMMEDR